MRYPPSLRFGCALAALALMVFPACSRGDILHFNIAQFTGHDPATGTVTFQDSGPGQVLVTLNITSPATSDIRGFFFNVADNSLLPGIGVIGAPVTSFLGSSVANAPEIDMVGGGNNTSPVGYFDVGVELGVEGGTDIGNTTSFSITGLGAPGVYNLVDDQVLSSGYSFLVRVQAGSGADQSFSSRLVGGGGDVGPAQIIPEPASLLLWGTAALAGLGWVRRRRAATP